MPTDLYSIMIYIIILVGFIVKDYINDDENESK